MSAEPLAIDPNDSLTEARDTVTIARNAAIVSLGKGISLVLGLARESVKSAFFGAGAVVDAFNIAQLVPRNLFDLLVGGLVNSALVPIFSELRHENQQRLWGLVSALLSLIVVVTSAIVLITQLLPTQVAFLLSVSAPAETLSQAGHLLRITSSALVFLSIAAVLSGLLYSFERFFFPAFISAIYNAAMVGATILWHDQLGIASMAVGLLIGSILQVLLLLPGLRGMRIWSSLKLYHPEMRRVLILYTPIVIGLVIDVLVARLVSYNLATYTTGEGGISWMEYATTLRQFPQGLVATAISFAVLPTLSMFAAAESSDASSRDAFKATLARGIRLTLVLIIPATIGLFVLAVPTVQLLFEWGASTPYDTQVTATALQLYLLGLPFAAVDLLLVFTFYSRQDTLTPALIGVYTIVFYLALAIILIEPFGLYSLMIADSVKLLLHMLISAVLLLRQIGSMQEHGIMRTTLLTCTAAAVMGGVAYGISWSVTQILPGTGLLDEGLRVFLPALVGAGLYFGLMNALKVEEVNWFWTLLRQRLFPDAP
ncbi:MAG: murein biosynthesis integral membrane protein MurJ [Chloroflexi bacterium]|nr:murein biosynthesis integral membrane protein MurJ [Chloroflexota bacterium]